VLVVGRLDRGKGVADVVHAVRRLGAAGHDIVLVAAGDGEEREGLRRLAASLGIAERVHLLGYRSDVGELLTAADVFVIASYGEGLPIALIEAMALARPVVSTRVGEIANVLESGRSGRLLDPGDIDALSAAIESVVTSPDEAQRLARAGLQRYHARYSRAAMVQRYRQLYATLF
jgi:glycosyltransferase involved in cell wall biosynthesis